MDKKVQSYISMFENIDDLNIDKEYSRPFACLLSLNDVSERRFKTIANLMIDHKTNSMKLKSDTHYLIATLIAAGLNRPEKIVTELLDKYEKMLERKFQPGIFTLLAAGIVLRNETAKTFDDLLLSVKETYENMESIQPFLTTTYSYPLATLLTLSGADDRIDDSKELYRLLSLNGFKKGRDLQLLTHVLLLHNEKNMKRLAERGVNILMKFKSFNNKCKKEIYPLLGLLSFVPTNQLDMEAVTLTSERLQDGRYAYVNLMVTIILYVSDYIDLQTLTPITLTIIEKYIQDSEAFNPTDPKNIFMGLF